jgi:hypothetical protein
LPDRQAAAKATPCNTIKALGKLRPDGIVHGRTWFGERLPNEAVEQDAPHVVLVLRSRGSNHIATSINLVLRSALLRASRRTATSEILQAAILRDAQRAKRRAELLRMRSGSLSSICSIPIVFMESIS